MPSQASKSRRGILSAAGEVNTSVDNSWRRLRMLLVRRWRAVWKRPKQPPPPASGKQQAGATRTTVTVTTTRARTIIKFTDHGKEEKEAPPKPFLPLELNPPDNLKLLPRQRHCTVKVMDGKYRDRVYIIGGNTKKEEGCYDDFLILDF